MELEDALRKIGQLISELDDCRDSTGFCEACQRALGEILEVGMRFEDASLADLIARAREDERERIAGALDAAGARTMIWRRLYRNTATMIRSGLL